MDLESQEIGSFGCFRADGRQAATNRFRRRLPRNWPRRIAFRTLALKESTRP